MDDKVVWVKFLKPGCGWVEKAFSVQGWQQLALAVNGHLCIEYEGEACMVSKFWLE